MNKTYALAIVCAALVAMSPAACTMHSNRVLTEAVKAGADPIAMNCAMSVSTNSNTAICAVAAMRGKP